MYKINDIFYLDNEYSARANFCNKNNLMIVEIEPDEQGRRFQIQEPPKPTETDLAMDEMNNLKCKLAEMDYKTSKYVDGDYSDEEWQQIVSERQTIRLRIRELEKIV